MQISNQSGISREKQLSHTIQQIQNHLDLANSGFAKYFNIEDYQLIHSFSPSALEKIAKQINISLEQLLRGELDLDHLFEKEQTIAPRFQQFQTSKNLAVENILSYLKENFPTHYDTIIRELNLNEQMFENPVGSVGVALINQIYLLMQKYCFAPHIFEHIGKNSILQFKKKTTLLADLSNCKNLLSALELFFYSSIKKIDNTWEYCITSLQHDHLIVRATTKEETAEYFKTNHFGSSAICQHRIGVAKSLGILFGDLKIKVIEQKCIHRNDPWCEYRVEVDQSVMPLYQQHQYLQ